MNEITAQPTTPSSRVMGFTELKRWLRHRHPMIFLDRVTDFEPGKSLTALMAVSGQTDAIAGHFPERAVFPASHMMQAISQAGIILFQVSTSPLRQDEITLVGSVKARFTRVVVPGDVLIFNMHCDSLRDDFMTFTCQAEVSGQVVGTLKGSLVRKDISVLGEQLW